MKQPTRVPSFVPTIRLLTAGVLAVQISLPAGLLAQTVAPQPEQGRSAALQPRDADGQADPGARISGDERLLMILDRFTYGPRPGNLSHLRTIGLNEWFKQQMNPQLIDDSALETRLAKYPAMHMPLDKLMTLYPSNQMIRASLDGRAGVPGGAAAHAIYADQQELYKENKADQDKKAKTKNGDLAHDAEAVSLPQTSAEILALEPEKRFRALCHLTLPQLRELRRSFSPEQRQQLTAGMTAAQTEAIAAFNGPAAVVAAEDAQVKLLRDVYSERQLEEVMVDFWLNHFNVYIAKSQDAPYYIAVYERDAIRPHALGRFQDLLLATATSPAMLNYLDNSQSAGPHSEFVTGRPGFPRPGNSGRPTGLNENYAREVMELHTVGVSGGYTQKDVTELAKVFTGWTVGPKYGGEVAALAQYDPAKHEPGRKVVMEHVIQENGQREGIAVLKMLAASPQCARFISTKLAVRFVSDTPPPAMVDRMTNKYLETQGDIRQVLLAMVNSPEFFTASTFRAKLKTPQDFVISAVRATGAEAESTAGMQRAIADLGMPLYGMQTPNGYSMKAEAWNSTTQLVSRMNCAMALATNRVQGLKSDPDSLLGAQAQEMTPQQKMEALEAALLHAPVSARTQQLILAQVSVDARQQVSELRQISAVNGRDPLSVDGPGRAKSDGTAGQRQDTQAQLAAGLILGSPEFQRR